MSAVSKSFPYGSLSVTIETGELARQAEGAVRVTMGDTVVLVTVCAQQTAVAGRDFFPLTVNYVEKTYAAGRIPGGFFKREGRPTEKETLTSRLCDRPIRPSAQHTDQNRCSEANVILRSQLACGDPGSHRATALLLP